MRSVRSETDLQKAKKCAELLYGGIKSVDRSSLEDILDELPLSEFSEAELAGKSITDLIVSLGLAPSKSEYSLY